MARPKAAESIPRRAISIVLRRGLGPVLVSLAFVLAQVSYRLPQQVSDRLPQPFTALALPAIAIPFGSSGIKPAIFTALIARLVRGCFFEPNVGTESRLLYGVALLVLALVMALVMREADKLAARAAEEGIWEREYELRQTIETVPALPFGQRARWRTAPCQSAPQRHAFGGFYVRRLAHVFCPTGPLTKRAANLSE